MIKLNLGCGLNLKEGWINVDKMPYHGSQANLVRNTQFVQCDLETFPWPWANDSIEAVQFIHALEHIGSDPEIFLRMFVELYRICKPGAEIFIVVPHPRHDFFYGDVTHVRPINEYTFQNFSKKFCAECAARGYSNTPFATYYGFDFEFVGTPNWKMSSEFQGKYDAGLISPQEVLRRGKTENNFIEEIHITLKVMK